MLEVFRCATHGVEVWLYSEKKRRVIKMPTQINRAFACDLVSRPVKIIEKSSSGCNVSMQQGQSE